MSAPTTYRTARLQAVVDKEANLFPVRDAGAQQRLRGVVRGVSHVMVFAIGRGEASYHWFLDWAASPIVVVVNIVALAFAVLHTVTWFALTPAIWWCSVADSCPR